MKVPSPLQPAGLQVLAASMQTRGSKFRVPPVALTEDGPWEVEYLDDLNALAPSTQLIWTWPGQWRSLPFLTTAGELKEQAVKEWDKEFSKV